MKPILGVFLTGVLLTNGVMYNSDYIKTIEGLGNSSIEISASISDSIDTIELENHVLMFDTNSNIAYTKVSTSDKNIWVDDENTHSVIEIYQDGNNGILYQKEDENEWGSYECEAYNAAVTYDDLSFKTLCGKGWVLENETKTELYLTRNLDSILGSGYMNENYMLLFGMFNDMLYTDYSSSVVLDKRTRRLKTYEESVTFYTDKINGEIVTTADDNKASVEVENYTCTVKISVSSIDNIPIPEGLVLEQDLESNESEEFEESAEFIESGESIVSTENM